jgi:hypothetical protein
VKDFAGIPYASLPDPTAPDFSNRLRNILGTIDAWARDASQGMSRLKAGQVPTGSGTSVFGNSAITLENAGTNSVQPASQSGNIQEWRDFSGTLRLAIDQFGIMRFTGSTWTVLTALANAGVSPAGILFGQGLSIITYPGGVVVAGIDTAGSATFSGLTTSSGFIVFDADGLVDTLPLKDSGTGFIGILSWAGIGSGETIALPVGANSTLLSNNSTINVSNKTLLTSTVVRCNTGTGVTFQDQTGTTKQMRFDLSGITAATTRAQKWQDTAGSVVTVGNTASASGVLGTIALTAQTNSLAAQTLLTGNASSAGLYRLSFYLKTTTAGSGGDVVKVTAAWNDGAAQTLDVPMLNATAIVNNLDLSTLNAFVQGSIVVKAAASQNVTFTTTVTKAGSPVYSVDARIESLG